MDRLAGIRNRNVHSTVHCATVHNEVATSLSDLVVEDDSHGSEKKKKAGGDNVDELEIIAVIIRSGSKNVGKAIAPGSNVQVSPQPNTEEVVHQGLA